MDKKQTSDEALDMALTSYKKFALSGSNYAKDANHIIARTVVERERGHYSDPQPDYALDQETRDRLLVHARQDAAEALLHTRSIMDEIHKLNKAQSFLGYGLLLTLVVATIWKYWPLGN